MQFGLEKQFGCVCHVGAVYVNLFGSPIADLYQMGRRAGILAGHAVRDKSVPGNFLPKEQLSSRGIFGFNLITEYLLNSYSRVIVRQYPPGLRCPHQCCLNSLSSRTWTYGDGGLVYLL